LSDGDLAELKYVLNEEIDVCDEEFDVDSRNTQQEGSVPPREKLDETSA